MESPNKNWWRCRLIVALIVLVVGAASMPREQYIGDPLAIRAVAVQWLNHGEFFVPEEVALNSGQRGQYYFQNPRNGRYYSKYGPLNTLGYLPALAVERALTGELPLYNPGPARTLILNLNNILLSAILALLLLEIGRLYCAQPSLAAVWVLASLYGGFGWNYLRAQTSELAQWLWASAFMLGLLRCWRSRGAVRYQVLASVSLSLLILLKGVYALWGPILVVAGAALCARISKCSEGAKKAAPLGGLSRTRWLLYLALPLALGAIAVLAINYIKFGDALASGYTQWERERHFFQGNIWEGMWGFLVSPAKSIFIYQPLLLIAVWYWPQFWRRYKGEAALIPSCFATLWIFNSCTINWGGHWSYGPRYLLVILTPLSLSALMGIEGWWQKRARLKFRALLAALAVGLLFSGWLQCQVNALDYFTYYRVEAMVQACGSPRATSCLQRQPFGWVNFQLRRFAQSDRLPDFAQIVAQEAPPEVSSRLQSGLMGLVKDNYWW